MPISAEQKEELTQKILTVTERQIAANGLAAVSTRSIGREAECSGGSIYTRFADFDDLILAVNARVLARFGDVLHQVRAQTATLPVEERLCQMAFAYLDFAAEQRNTWSALFEHRMAEGKPLPDWHLQDHLDLFALIEEPLRELDPNLSPQQSMRLARTVYSAVHGIVSLSLEDRLGRIETETIREQLRLVLVALSAGWQVSPPSLG